MAVLQTFHGVYLWRYVPSIPAGVVFCILFAIATAAHSWVMVRTKSWFCLPFVIGGVLEVMGFAARAASADHTGELIPYLLQSLFLVVPPVLFAASLYMVYSRIVRAVDGDRFSPTAPRLTTRLFVIGDIACLNVQSSGAGLLAKPKNANIGKNIVIAGLLLQVLLFMVFLWCCITFHRRFRAYERQKGAGEVPTQVPWRACFYVLYATSGAILARNTYRVVEYIMGLDSYLNTHEWPAYALDGVLMLLVMIVFCVWHPHRLLGGGHHTVDDGDTADMELTRRSAEVGGQLNPNQPMSWQRIKPVNLGIS